jgi:uncharacterized membrane protein YoaT (DUF817 family)
MSHPLYDGTTFEIIGPYILREWNRLANTLADHAQVWESALENT